MLWNTSSTNFTCIYDPPLLRASIVLKEHIGKLLKPIDILSIEIHVVCYRGSVEIPCDESYFNCTGKSFVMHLISDSSINVR